MNIDTESLTRRAAAGDSAAQFELGHRAQRGGDHQAARGWFANAAQSGSAEALRLLAVSLLVFSPLAMADGIAMVRQAAAQGDVEALYICAALAANDDGLQDRWPIALDYLLRAAGLGHGLAQKELALLSGRDGDDWRAMRDAVDIGAWLGTPSAKILSGSPAISTFESFLSPALCDWVIERAKGRTIPATVYIPADAGAGRMEDMRTNSHAGFNVAECGTLLMLIRARIAAVSNIAPPGHEWPMALHYRVGESYKPHFDFLDTRSAALAADVARSGQRIATFLIYLNDDFDGGETDFPRLDIRYRGRKGDALLFRSVENGKPDARTLHAGLAPTRGEKWLYSQWIREPKV